MTPKSILAIPGLHYLARRFGWAALRTAAFDAKHESGEWSGHREPQEFVDLVARYTAGRTVLVMGCGTNPLGRQMPEESYEWMVGVDVSPKAIKLARLNKMRGHIYEVADMRNSDISFLFCWTVVVFPESIYYLNPGDALTALRRHKKSLTFSGHLIVTISDPRRYGWALELIRQNFKVVEDRPICEGCRRHVIVFK
jgi:SAM-dependent methyltransferase